ncbi:MAG: class II aldolase/adducin family protein [Methermicoccaceae archaeon]
MDSMETEALISVGKRLVERGYTDSFFGNISFRKGDVIYITPTGSALELIKKDDLVEVPLSGSYDRRASSETPAHRYTYNHTHAHAIVHAHAFFSVLCSFFVKDVLSSRTGEGRLLLPSIAFCEDAAGTETLGVNIVEAHTRYQTPLVVAKGHGVFALGESLEQAYTYCVIAEHECRLWYHLMMAGSE